MQSMLEEIGYEIVDNVIVYEQAVEVLKNKEVDLVLIDIILASDKTGIDLGKHIRENYNIPFIFVHPIPIGPLLKCEDRKPKAWADS